MTDTEKLTLLLGGLDLLSILEQNDIEHLTVLEVLYKDGWIDVEDYFYEDVPQYLQEIEE